MDQNSQNPATGGGDRSTPTLSQLDGSILARAFLLARLTPTESVLIGQLPGTLRCRIHLSELGSQLGIGYPLLIVAKRRLIASRILIEDEDGTIRINANAGEWTQRRNDEPLLSPADVEQLLAEPPPEYEAVRWFTALVVAQDGGEFAAAAEAQGQLERLGYSVRYRKPGTDRPSSKGGHR